MVVKSIQNNIFNSEAKHIAFAVNTEGINNFGVAHEVISTYWPELRTCGELELGEVISKNVGDKTFHALVCHSLVDGWEDNQAEIIKKCFDLISANGELIATVAIGTGLVGKVSGADFRQIVCGMHDSHQRILLYSDYTLKTVLDWYIEEKTKIKEANLLLDSHKKGSL